MDSYINRVMAGKKNRNNNAGCDCASLFDKKIYFMCTNTILI